MNTIFVLALVYVIFKVLNFRFCIVPIKSVLFQKKMSLFLNAKNSLLLVLKVLKKFLAQDFMEFQIVCFIRFIAYSSLQKKPKALFSQQAARVFWIGSNG